MFSGALSSILFSLVFLSSQTLATQPGNCPILPTTDASRFSQIKFDYLIVGGGTSGLTLASRLTQNQAIVVGVIEAGAFHHSDPLVDTPNFNGRAIGNSTYDWNYVTQPNAGLAGRPIAQPRGKMLGGSSGLNAMAWTRPSRNELDAFDVFAPGFGWNWEGLLPHFKVTEGVMKQTNPFPGIPKGVVNDNGFRGHDGPVQASLNVIYPDIVPQYVKAHNAIGIKTNPTPDNGDATGMTNSFLSIDRSSGTRSYAATAIFCPSASRPNLHVLINAQASKIVFRELTPNPQPLFAEGVQFSAGSKTFTAKASKEVIISAGVVQSPQLLELSGIGNEQILKKFGIKTLNNLPGVGENLQEHLFSPVEFLLKDGHLTFDMLRNNATFAAQQAAQYAASGTGWLAAVDCALSFLPLPEFMTKERVQSLIATFDSVASKPGLTPLQHQQYAIQRKWLTDSTVPQTETILFSKGLINPQPGQSYMSVIGGILHPMSRGSIHINSTDPLAPPVLTGNYFGNAFDSAVVLESLKFIAGLAKISPVSSVIQNITFPILDFNDDTAVAAFIQQSVSPADHITGTCPMAPQKLGGVVDGSLKVYNTSNLRVVDASTIPMLVGAHIQTMAYAIGDKAADMILSGHH